MSRHRLKEIRRHREAGSVDIETVEEEKACISIFGKPCTLEELLDLEEEQEIGENPDSFEGGDTEIIQMAQAEIGLGSGDIEEIDLDDEPEVVPPPLKEVMKMCHTLEEYSMVISPQGTFTFVKALCEYQGHLAKIIRAGEKQTTLDTFFGL